MSEVTEAPRPDLDLAEARDLTDRIRDKVAELLPLIIEAYHRRADRALGYGSWNDYCDAELRGLRLPVERREAVRELRSAGMSTRAIGAALGVSKGTVHNELSGAQKWAPPPRSVTGDDGKVYQPVRSTRSEPETETDPVAIVAEAIDRLLPPDPDEPYRQWRRNFLTALASGRTAMQFEVDSVAMKADDECIDELGRLAADLASYASRVMAKRPALNNVRRLKAV